MAQDLSPLDFSQFKASRLELDKNDTQLNTHLPQPLLDPVKHRAKARGIPYTRLIRETPEHAMTKENSRAKFKPL